MPKSSLKKNSCDAIKSITWEDKDVHSFAKSIHLKVNGIMRLEFEFTYCNVAVQLVSHYLDATI